jgi:phosphoribosyl 1,2-cyclic phosphate phosphodiesterase
MILTFLGTAAAEGYPNPFCRCKNCERARALGGPSLRKRSAALINDDLLIDLGPDLIAASVLHGRPLAGLRYCLQTHAHADHLDPSHFLSRSPEYGVPGAPRLHFYASTATVQRAARILEADFAPASLLDPEVSERLNLEIHVIEPLQSFNAGPYQVTALPANHDPAVDPLLYAIEAEGRRIFYGTDTAILPEESWRAFHRHERRFDVVILDHTYGPDEPGSDHLNAQQFIEHVARMREEHLLAPDARVLATHLAHAGNPVHPELAELAAQYGYEVAYDGLTV